MAALPSAERKQLLAHCEPVELAFGERLCEQGDRIRRVYFPTGGFISLISSIDGRPRLEVGLVGTEGMLGVSLLVGVNDAPLRALVQGAGPALRIEAADFSRVLKRSPMLRQALMRYLYVLMSPARADDGLYSLSCRRGTPCALAPDDTRSRPFGLVQPHAGVPGVHAGCTACRHHACRSVVATT